MYLEFLMGIPGSGKSTYAKKKVLESNGSLVRINKDDIRAEIRRSANLSEDARVKEPLVIQIEEKRIRETLKDGKSVILDNTHLNPSHEQRIKNLLKEFPGVEFVKNEDFLSVPVEECIRRDSFRVGFERVGPNVIRKMWSEYQQNKGKGGNPNRDWHAWMDRLWSDDKSRIPAVICDLDGTLALMSGRSPYDTNVAGDVLNTPVADAVRALTSGIGDPVLIFVSGRTEEARASTQEWLDRNGFSKETFDKAVHCQLLMRKTGDSRPDDIVKTEIYKNEIEPKYFVQFVFDDRPKVVRMWRSLGLFVFNCAQSDEEF